VCDKVSSVLERFNHELTDIQQRILGTQIPGIIGIQPNNVPFQIAPRPDYRGREAPKAPSWWDSVRRTFGG
jgi:hypothetical protein